MPTTPARSDRDSFPNVRDHERLTQLLNDAYHVLGTKDAALRAEAKVELAKISEAYLKAVKDEATAPSPTNKEAQKQLYLMADEYGRSARAIQILTASSRFGLATDNAFRSGADREKGDAQMNEHKALVRDMQEISPRLSNLEKRLRAVAGGKDIAGKEHLRVSVDAHGSPEKQLVNNCACLILKFQRNAVLQQSPTGNLGKLSWAAYELATGKTDKRLKGIVEAVAIQHRESRKSASDKVKK